MQRHHPIATFTLQPASSGTLARARRGRTAVVAPLVLYATLLASDPHLAFAADRLEQIDVIADPISTGDVIPGDHVGSQTRIEGEALERRDVELADVLARETGVQRRTSGGFGSFSSVTVRAASPAQTSIHLDGIRLNSAGQPVIDLATLELLSLESIDLYRGTTPLQLGRGGIGGAIDLRTPAVRPGERITRVLGGIASFGTVRGEVLHRARYARWDAVVAVSTLESDNDFSFVDGNGTPLNPDDDRRERRYNAGVRRAGVLAKVGTDHGDAARSEVLIQAQSRELGIPEWRNARDNDARLDTDTLQLQLTHRRDRIGEWNSSHTAFVHAGRDLYDDSRGQIGLGSQLTETRARTLGIDGFWERPLGTGLAELAWELRRESLVSRDPINDENDLDARRIDAALSGQWSWFSADGRTIVSPGLQVRRVDDEVTRWRSDTGRGDRSGSTLTPQIALRREVSASVSLHASVGRFEREPSFSELFVDRGLARGNPTLEAERGTNAEIGLAFKPGARFSLESTLFASRREELIATVYDTRGVGRAVNTGRARIAGIELSGMWQPTPKWQLRANLTLQDAHAVSDNAALDHKQIPGEARETFHARLRYAPHRRWQLWLEADARRRRFYDQANVRAADDTLLSHAGIDWRHRRLHAAFAIHNLGDRNVEDYNGFPRPGRAFSLNITLDFKEPPT